MDWTELVITAKLNLNNPWASDSTLHLNIATERVNGRLKPEKRSVSDKC